MEIKVINSTSCNHANLFQRTKAAWDLLRGKYTISKEQALDFGGKAAGVCYLPDNVENIFKEDPKLTKGRIKRTLSSGHQSVYGHPVLNLDIKGLSKIMAMVLNNEKVYTTSEKSARYTRMQPTKQELTLYNKWMKNFDILISKRYPEIKEDHRTKLAQENARYMISVFTPTTMEHTIDFRQANYIMHWFEDFIETAKSTRFNNRLKTEMKEFNFQLKDFYVSDIKPKDKERYLSLFSLSKRNNVKEEFGETYTTSYHGSFAHLAQAHRHRTIDYRINEIEDDVSDFFVPLILKDNDKLVKEWLSDLSIVAENYPQGIEVLINERGTPEDLISKCGERLCGHPQLEIMLQTKHTIDKYTKAVKDTNLEVFNMLLPYSKGARCTFPDYICPSKCVFGGKRALERLI